MKTIRYIKRKHFFIFLYHIYFCALLFEMKNKTHIEYFCVISNVNLLLLKKRRRRLTYNQIFSIFLDLKLNNFKTNWKKLIYRYISAVQKNWKDTYQGRWGQVR